jgi:predicted transposase YbfD/YdcC
MDINNAASLLAHFVVVQDPRRDHGKLHNLLDIIGITICATISGADDWMEISQWAEAKQDWLQTFLELPNGIPSHDTMGRVFASLDPDEFQAGFVSWVQAISQLVDGEVIAIDGKTARRAYEKEGNPLHIVSAFATTNGITLGQRAIDKKSNEITAIPKLLKTLQLKGCIVTIDAMGCQKDIAETVLKGKADYVLAVKGNQKIIYQDLQHLFSDGVVDQYTGDQFEVSEKGSGREEVRRCRTITDPALLPANDVYRYDWPGLKSLAQVVSERTSKGKTTVEVRYYLSSLAGNAKELASAVRSHWQIENSLHWSLDVSFREDESRVWKGYAQQNLSLVRKLALALLKNETTAKIGVAAKRMKAGWDNNYLTRVLAGAKL